MSIIRAHRHDKNFTAIDNRTLRDDRLSLKARGLLCYLLSLPPDSQINREFIARHAPDGVKAIRSGLKELADHGYTRYERIQGKDGRWSTVTHVYERPVDNAKTEGPKGTSGLTSANGVNPQVAPKVPFPTVGAGASKDLKTLNLKTQKKARAPEPNHEAAAKYSEIRKQLGVAPAAGPEEPVPRKGSDGSDLQRVSGVLSPRSTPKRARSRARTSPKTDDQVSEPG